MRVKNIMVCVYEKQSIIILIQITWMYHTGLLMLTKTKTINIFLLLEIKYQKLKLIFFPDSCQSKTSKLCLV